MDQETAIVKRQGMPLTNLAEVASFGKALAESGLFKLKTPQAGAVLAMYCHTEGITPFQFFRTFDIIDGNLSMKAAAMLAEFRTKLNGRHEIVERTPERACVKLILDDQEEEFSLTWEEAQKEPFVYTKAGGLKNNWKTPRIRKQMLWARVISDGVNAIAPEISAGLYPPEIMEDLADMPDSVPKDITDQVITEPAMTAQEPEQPASKVIDVEPEPEDAIPISDELKKMALELIAKERKASVTLFVKKLQLGQEKAKALIQVLEDEGYVSPMDNRNQRTILFELPDPDPDPEPESESESESEQPAEGDEPELFVDEMPLTEGLEAKPSDPRLMPFAKFQGNPWCRFTVLQLEAILEKKHDAITSAHKDMVKKELRRREDAETTNP